MSKSTNLNPIPRPPAQTEASRTNGAKSLGATTEEGKCKTNQAHMVHGFRSHQVVIHNEDKQAYDDHLDTSSNASTPSTNPKRTSSASPP